MTPIEWELRLHNDVSSAAKQAGVDVRDFVSTMRQAQLQLDALATAEKLEARAAGEAKKEHEGFFGDMLKAEFWEQRIEQGIDLVKELGEAFIESATEAIDFDYKATVAMTHLTGTAEGAKDILDHAHAFALGVGEDLDKVVTTFEHLAATGLKGDQLTAAAAAAKDLSVVTGRSFDQTSQLFELIGSDRGLGGRAVRQLAQFPPLLNALEKHFGFVPGTARSFEQLSKHLEQAPIKGAQGLATLEEMIRQVAHEENLGDVGVEIGESFEGSANKIKSDWKLALGSMADDPAVKDIRRDIEQIADYFAPANEGGKKLAETMHEIVVPFHELFEIIARNPGIISGVFDSAAVVVKFVVTEVEGLLVLIKKVQDAGAYLGALFETGSFKKAGEVVDEARNEDDAKEMREREKERQSHLTPQEKREEAEMDASFANMKPRELPPLAPLPSKADGGTVTDTGLVTVHKGEEIRPADVTQSYGGDTSNVGGHTFNFHVTMPAGAGGGHSGDEQLEKARMQELMLGALMSALEQLNQMKGGK